MNLWVAGRETQFNPNTHQDRVQGVRWPLEIK